MRASAIRAGDRSGGRDDARQRPGRAAHVARAVSAEHAIDCGPSVARWMSPIAIVGSALVTHGGYGHNYTYCVAPQLTLTNHPDMTTWSQGPALTPRNAHLFMEFEGKLLYGGGQLTSGPVASSCASAAAEPLAGMPART